MTINDTATKHVMLGVKQEVTWKLRAVMVVVSAVKIVCWYIAVRGESISNVPEQNNSLDRYKITSPAVSNRYTTLNYTFSTQISSVVGLRWFSWALRVLN